MPACAMAQALPKIEVSADLIIPQPPPTAPASEWHDAPGRKAVSINLGGAELRGFRYQGKNPFAPEILFFNGNGMTVLRTEPFYRSLAERGPSVTVYDYRGYGFSGGRAHLEDFRVDALHAYDALVKTAKGGKVVVYGASMGTAPAAYIASRRQVAGLILGMPIASAEEEFPVYAKLMGYSDTQLSMTSIAPTAASIFGEAALVKTSQAPLLVLGGAKDNVVPVTQAREVYAASPAATKKIVEVPGAGHNDVIISTRGVQAVLSFVSALK